MYFGVILTGNEILELLKNDNKSVLTKKIYIGFLQTRKERKYSFMLPSIRFKKSVNGLFVFQ